MILAEKIIELRKKNGWSQEELAEKLEVSRQAVSKWESAQSVPDMNRVLLLSKVFGVSTDYLLKDELGGEAAGTADLPEDAGKSLRQVTMREAQSFMRLRKQNAGRIALGVLLCVLSPAAIILLSVGQETGRFPLTETQATGFGLLPLLLLVGAAVALFVTSGLAAKPFEFMEKECFETEYGVSGYVKEQRERERGAFVGKLVAGVVLCVLAAVPIFVAMLLPGGSEADESFRYAVAVAALLCTVAFGVWLIVGAAIRWGSFSILLEEDEHSRENKREMKRNETVSAVYWCVVTAGYLAYSFITMDWQRSWIVWPVAGVLFGVVLAAASALRKHK